MKTREFFNKISNSKTDFLQEFTNVLKEKKVPFCIIGGLGVNAYTEPVVTLDCDFVVASSVLDETISEIKKRYKIKKFKHSINIYSDKSDLRIQIQTDTEFQKFLDRAAEKEVLGYKLPVAAIEDVFKSKIKVAMEPQRRESKRRKDQADILRLIEVKKELIQLLPEKLKNMLNLKPEKKK